MSEALLAVLPLAVAVGVFPIPVIASVLLVGSERGTTKGAAFVATWAAGLALAGAIVLALGAAASTGSDEGSPTWAGVALVALGAVALAAAAKQWRGRPRAGEEPTMPGWMRAVDGLTPARAGAAGLALAVLNPKNLLLAVAAAAEIAEADLPAGQEAGALAAFVLVASLGVLTPLVLAVTLGDRSRPLLEGIRGWMTRHAAVVMAVLLALIGVKLVIDGVRGLAG